jgi:hypothetical protein
MAVLLPSVKLPSSDVTRPAIISGAMGATNLDYRRRRFQRSFRTGPTISDEILTPVSADRKIGAMRILQFNTSTCVAKM